MSEPTPAELVLVNAKAKCFATCGALDPSVAADRALAAAVHEEHRVELEQAYVAFQQAVGQASASNPATGDTPLEARVTVDSGLT